MTQLSLSRQQMIEAWRQSFATEDMLNRMAAVFPTWRLLAEGLPVSPQQVADAVNRPVNEVKDDLHRVEETGFFGTDEQGNIVNFFGLELRPTPHRMQIGGQKLFAG